MFGNNNKTMLKKCSGSIRNNLEMRPSGRNEGPTTMVVVDESSNLFLFDVGSQFVDDN